MFKLAAAALFAVLFSFPALAWDQAAMNAQVDATNYVYDNDCSATLIGHTDKGNALFLTAKHCTYFNYKEVKRKVKEDDGSIKEKTFRIPMQAAVSQKRFNGATTVGEDTYNVKIKADSYDRDVAILETIAPMHGAQAPLSCKPVSKGDKVYAVGNPAIVFYGAYTEGTVTSVNLSYRDIGLTDGSEILPDFNTSPDAPLILHTAQIAGGSSGGPLYDNDGKIVGVNVMSMRGFFMSVPVNDIKDFLANNGVKIACK